jgi:hypothetical protein
MTTQEQRVKDYIAKTGRREDEAIRLALKKQVAGPVPMAVIRAVLAGEAVPEIDKPLKDATKKVKTIPLGGNVRVSDRKPQDAVKAKIYTLRKGQGHPVDELAQEWCVGSETIRNHARNLGCLKYVEESPGQWVLCVLHPDTAKDYKN